MYGLLRFNDIIGNYPNSWFIPYEVLLKTQEWHELRTTVLGRDGNKCTICHQQQSEKVKGEYYRVPTEEEITENDKPVMCDLIGDGSFLVEMKPVRLHSIQTSSPVILHVHHTYYIYGNNPWDYPIDAFITVCHHCHTEIHQSNIIPVHFDEKKDMRVSLTPCKRCQGTGYLREYYYYQNDICFSCGGRKYEELSINLRT